MGHPKKKVHIEWSRDFAYAIGLIVTDGCLLNDGRHIEFNSKDLELVNNLQGALKTNFKISKKTRSKEEEKKYHRIQIGDVVFYRFLESIGLMQRKSKIMEGIKVPDKHFGDFLRGHFDGDGSFYSYWDPRWKSSYMYYTVFNSASKKHIDWLRSKLINLYKVRGHISKGKDSSVYALRFAKTESNVLIDAMYHKPGVMCLQRKRLKIFDALSIVGTR